MKFGVLIETTHELDRNKLFMSEDTWFPGTYVVVGRVTNMIYARFDNESDAMAYQITRSLSDHGFNPNEPNKMN